MKKLALVLLFISGLQGNLIAETETITKQSNFDKLSEFIEDLVPYYLTDLSTVINPSDALTSFIDATSPYITYPEKLYSIYEYLPVFGDWKFYITPTLDVIYNNVDNYINLEPHPIVSNGQIQHKDLRDFKLIVKNYNQRNLRIRKKQLNGAIGVKGHLPPELVSSLPIPIAPFFGIMPAAGRTKTSYQISSSMSAAEDRKFPEIPRNTNEALQMNEGELVSYMATGGITFNAGISCYGLTLGTSALAVGEWQVVIKRLENSNVEVTYLNNSLKHFNLFASFVVLSTSVAYFTSYQHSLAFEFNLVDPYARDAFEEMLRGNLLRADHYRKNLNNPYITQIEQKNIEVKGVKTNHSISIPLIYRQSLSNNMIQIAEDIVNKESAEPLILWRGAYLKREDKKVLLTKSSQVEAFLGTITKEPNRDRNFSAQIIVNYEHQRTKRDHLIRMFRRMVQTFGQSQYVWIQIPDQKDFPERKIGYTGLRLTMDFSTDAINSLIEIGGNPSLLNKFIQTPNKLLESYISNNIDQNVDPNLACLRTSLSSLKPWDQCKKALRRETQNIAQKIATLLPQISSLANTLNMQERSLSTEVLLEEKQKENKQEEYNKLSLLVGNFGELVMSNQFIFQTIFQFAKKYGVTMNYQIYGEKLSYINRTLTWPDKD